MLKSFLFQVNAAALTMKPPPLIRINQFESIQLIIGLAGSSHSEERSTTTTTTATTVRLFNGIVGHGRLGAIDYLQSPFKSPVWFHRSLLLLNGRFLALNNRRHRVNWPPRLEPSVIEP